MSEVHNFFGLVLLTVVITSPVWIPLIGINLLFWWNDWRTEKKHRKPIVCACRVGDRVGFVSQKVFLKGCVNYWKPYLAGEISYPVRPEPNIGRIVCGHFYPVFVFKFNSDECRRIIHSCYVQTAIFYVPDGVDNGIRSGTIDEAIAYFRGELRV